MGGDAAQRRRPFKTNRPAPSNPAPARRTSPCRDQQASAGDAADDRFAQPDVAQLTIELAADG
jgi:hypothetical protein